MACASLSACGQVARQRAQVRIFTLVKPAAVVGYDDVRSYRTSFVCGLVDVRDQHAAPVRHRFFYDSADNSAWIQAITDRGADARLYDRINLRIWARCMGLPRPQAGSGPSS
jgi:hypothetical protein